MIYIDDSGDNSHSAFVAILLPIEDWHGALNALKQHRRSLNRRMGVYVRREFHATELLGGTGRIGSRRLDQKARARIFLEHLRVLAALPSVRFCAAFSSRKQKHKAFEWMLNRLERSLKDTSSYGVMVCDRGSDGLYRRIFRKMRVVNAIPSKIGEWGGIGGRHKNIPIERIVEDPRFVESESNYFVQCADFCAYSLLRSRFPTSKARELGVDVAWEIVTPKMLPCSFDDPSGLLVVGRTNQRR